MPDSLSRMEDASLYVLDLLEPEAKAAFEAELETCPELQRHVDDLRVNLEALALAAPPSVPPARVWNHIAERIEREPQSRTATAASASVSLWPWIRSWLSNGWAVATATAAVFLVHLLLSPPVRFAARSNPSHANSASAPAPGAGSQDPNSTLHPPRPPSTSSPALAATRTSAIPSRSTAQTDADAARLQDRVRGLSDQVALLTRVLAQQAFVPPGAARLQVFRLVSTNGTFEVTDALQDEARRLAAVNPSPNTPGTPDPDPNADTPAASSSTPDVSLTLALAAARQLASYTATPDSALTPPGSDTALDPGALTDPGASFVATRNPQEANPTETPSRSHTGSPAPSDAASNPARDPIHVIDLAAAAGTNPGTDTPNPDTGVLSTTNGQAFGAFSPDTGQGAIAFRIATETGEPGVYQLWMTDARTGSVQSLGFASTSGQATSAQVLVLRFSLDSASLTQTTPTFLITREPLGGSVVPTGPVVAQPPPATGLFPNP